MGRERAPWAILRVSVLVAAVLLAGCTYAPIETPSPGRRGEGATLEIPLVEAARQLEETPSCTEPYTRTDQRRTQLNLTHASGMGFRYGVDLPLRWQADPDDLVSFQVTVRWKPTTVLTSKLSAEVPYAHDADLIRLEGASPLQRNVEVGGLTLRDAPVARILASNQDYAFAVAVPDQPVEVELVQTYRHCGP